MANIFAEDVRDDEAAEVLSPQWEGYIHEVSQSLIIRVQKINF